MNMNFKRKLPIPKEIKEQYPLTAELARVKEARGSADCGYFHREGQSDGADYRPLLSRSEDAVLDYATGWRACRKS